MICGPRACAFAYHNVSRRPPFRAILVLHPVLVHGSVLACLHQVSGSVPVAPDPHPLCDEGPLRRRTPSASACAHRHLLTRPRYPQLAKVDCPHWAPLPSRRSGPTCAEAPPPRENRLLPKSHTSCSPASLLRALALHSPRDTLHPLQGPHGHAPRWRLVHEDLYADLGGIPGKPSALTSQRY